MQQSIQNYGVTGIFDTSGDLHAGLDAFIRVILEIDLGITSIDVTLIDAKEDLLHVTLLNFSNGRQGRAKAT